MRSLECRGGLTVPFALLVGEFWLKLCEGSFFSLSEGCFLGESSDLRPEGPSEVRSDVRCCSDADELWSAIVDRVMN